MKPNNYFTYKVFLVIILLTFVTGAIARGQDVILKEKGDEIKANVGQVSDKDFVGHMQVPVFPVTANSFQTSRPQITDRDLQPAKTASIIHSSLIAPILILGSVSPFSKELVIRDGFGAVATVIAGIGIPVAAGIAGNTRKSTGAHGIPGLRIAGWIGYGLSMADAIVMLSLSTQINFSAESVLSVVILGALSTTFFAIDDWKTVSQVKSMQSKISFQPIIGSFRDLTGKHYQTIGLRMNF